MRHRLPFEQERFFAALRMTNKDDCEENQLAKVCAKKREALPRERKGLWLSLKSGSEPGISRWILTFSACARPSN
jgi:hypothetical protein